MNLTEGSALGEETAPFTFQNAEPTVHEFVPGHPVQAQRRLYTADASGFGYSLVVSDEAMKSPGLIRTVAGEVAAAINADALVPGVTDIGETQKVRPLGSLEDQYNVAIESTSGKSEIIATFDSATMRPDLFAAAVKYWRGVLDAGELST